MKAHLPYLDGWRGIAIGSVLMGHFFPRDLHFEFGRFGVDLFFVLSGLLMSRILFEERTPLGLFYRRRIARILPAFLLFIVIAVAIWGTTPKELLALVTFTRTYFDPPMRSSIAPVGHIWSLNVEEHCYLLLSLLAAFAFRARVVLIPAALCLVAITLHRALSSELPVYWMINTECAATGLLASCAYRSMKLNLPAWASPAALVAAILCYLSFDPWWLAAYMAPILLAIAVNHAGESILRKPLELKPLVILGVISYSVYLWQQPFMMHPPRHNLGVFGALAMGALSFYLFESPIRRWLNANWSKHAARLPNPSAACVANPDGGLRDRAQPG